MDIGAVTIVSLGVLAFGLVSAKLRQSIVTAAMVFVVFGAVIGEGGLGLVDFQLDNAAIDILAELALTVVLFTDAARLDVKSLRRQHVLPIRLLMIGLPLSIGLGTILAWFLFPDLRGWQAAVLATAVAPTDAALAHPVVTNRSVPMQIRQAISVESGLNDGLCLPLFLMLLCAARAAEHPASSSYWIGFAAMQVILGPLVGIAMGYVGGKLIELSRSRQWISHSFLDLVTLALALLAYSVAELVGGNGFIAAFCAGLAVGTVSKGVRQAIHEFAEAEGQLLSLVLFLVFGAVILPDVIVNLNWRVITFASLSLTLVRILSVGVSFIGTQSRIDTRWFIGWFGPRGIASIVFALVMLIESGIAGRQEIFVATMATVMLSVFCHGLTAYPLAWWYSRRVQSSKESEDDGTQPETA